MKRGLVSPPCFQENASGERWIEELEWLSKKKPEREDLGTSQPIPITKKMRVFWRERRRASTRERDGIGRVETLQPGGKGREGRQERRPSDFWESAGWHIASSLLETQVILQGKGRRTRTWLSAQQGCLLGCVRRWGHCFYFNWPCSLRLVTQGQGHQSRKGEIAAPGNPKGLIFASHGRVTLPTPLGHPHSKVPPLVSPR